MIRQTAIASRLAGCLLMTTALVAGGCLQGSEYRRPAVETPVDWGGMAGPLVSAVSNKVPEAEWWRSFRNEELTRFIERALTQNHDVRRAVSRVLEGRASVTTAGAGLYPQLNVQGGPPTCAGNWTSGDGSGGGWRPPPPKPEPSSMTPAPWH